MKRKENKKKTIVALVLILGLLVTSNMYGDSPRLLNFQGRLSDTSGVPIVGNTTITFSLYNQASGGTPLWTETQSVTSNDEGLYSVLLGGVTALNLDFDIQYYLGITISGEDEMTPRFQLGSTAYALNAVTSIDNVKNGGGNIDLVAGNNITITPNDATNTITFDASGGIGDITAVYAGSGLTGGGTSGDVTLSADMSVLAAIIHSHTVTSAMIQDGTITTADLAFTPLTNPYTGNLSITGDLDLTGTLDMMDIYDIINVDDVEAETINAEKIQLGYNYGAENADGHIYMYDEAGNETIELDSDWNAGGAILVKNDRGTTGIRLESDDYGDIALYAENGYCNIQLSAGYGTGEGTVRVNGSQVHDYADVFSFVSSAKPKPGLVATIAVDGKLDISSIAYDSKVAGIVAGGGDLKSGIVLGSDSSDPHTAPIAVSGRVYCYVDATENAIEIGDLLTTSNTPGYAMKVTDRNRAFGAVLGKAMEPLAKGKKGSILVLVCLN